jgi:hypothetical protein
VADTFALSAGETRLLLAAPRGQALPPSGSHRIAFDVVAADAEHALATE